MTALNIKTTFDADETKNVDVCIIGTGAGGAVVGYHLAQSGLKVLMLERDRDYLEHQRQQNCRDRPYRCELRQPS